MQNNNTLFVDKEGYQKLLDSIEELKKRIAENNSGRKDAFDASAGDGWDSPEFEEIERQDHLLTSELQRRYEELQRVVIIEKHNNDDIIDIGDVLRVEMAIGNEEFEDMVFKLVGTSGDFNADIQEISINSPLGNSVYKKQIGDQTSYSVGSRIFNVIIKEKIDLTEEQDNPTKTLSR